MHCVVLIIPSMCICGRDIVIGLFVIPSTCIRGRDIVIGALVRVCVCHRSPLLRIQISVTSALMSVLQIQS